MYLKTIYVNTILIPTYLAIFFVNICSQTITAISYNKSNSNIPSNQIQCILINDFGIWLGSRDNGLILFKDSTFFSYSTNNSPIPHNNVYCISQDSNSVLWLGTFGGGVVKFDYFKNKWTIFNTKNSKVKHDWIYSLAIDKNNLKWIGTWGNGVVVFDEKNNKWMNYTPNNSIIPAEKIPALFIDKKNNKWIGSMYGLVKLDNDLHWTFFNSYTEELEASVYSLNVQNDSIIWVGYKAYGLGRLSNDFKLFTKDNSNLPSNKIYSIAVDKDNKVWVATFGGGIAKYDKHNFIVFNTSNSEIQDDLVFDIKIDQYGNKYLGTFFKGLIKFNENGVK